MKTDENSCYFNRLTESWWKTQKALKCPPHWAARLPTAGLPSLLQLWEQCLAGLELLVIHPVVRTTWSGGLALFIAKMCMSPSLPGWAKPLLSALPALCAWNARDHYFSSARRGPESSTKGLQKRLHPLLHLLQTSYLLSWAALKWMSQNCVARLNPQPIPVVWKISSGMFGTKWKLPWQGKMDLGWTFLIQKQKSQSVFKQLLITLQPRRLWKKQVILWSKESSQSEVGWSQWVHMSTSTRWCFHWAETIGREHMSLATSCRPLPPSLLYLFSATVLEMFRGMS